MDRELKRKTLFLRFSKTLVYLPLYWYLFPITYLLTMKHFGKISALLLVLLFVVATHVGYAPFCFSKTMGLNRSRVVVAALLFLPMYYFLCYKGLLWAYRLALWGIMSSFLGSTFAYYEQSLMEKVLRGDLSMADRNASLALAAPILLAILLVLLLIYGAIFDTITRKRYKRWKKHCKSLFLNYRPSQSRGYAVLAILSYILLYFVIL